MGFLARIAGPRVLLGVVVAAVVVVGFVSWRWIDAEQDAARASAAADQAAQAAADNAAAATALREERDRLDDAVERLRQQSRVRQRALQAELQEVRDALTGDDCATRVLPAGARRVFPAADANGGADAGGAGDGAAEPDGADP